MLLSIERVFIKPFESLEIITFSQMIQSKKNVSDSVDEKNEEVFILIPDFIKDFFVLRSFN